MCSLGHSLGRGEGERERVGWEKTETVTIWQLLCLKQ